jgi:hypothetical protein
LLSRKADADVKKTLPGIQYIFIFIRLFGSGVIAA